jgi:transposase
MPSVSTAMWVKLKRLRPCASAMARLDPIPGVGPYLAEALIAEIGIDMRRFPSPAH